MSPLRTRVIYIPERHRRAAARRSDGGSAALYPDQTRNRIERCTERHPIAGPWGRPGDGAGPAARFRAGAVDQTSFMYGSSPCETPGSSTQPVNSREAARPSSAAPLGWRFGEAGRNDPSEDVFGRHKRLRSCRRITTPGADARLRRDRQQGPAKRTNTLCGHLPKKTPATINSRGRPTLKLKAFQVPRKPVIRVFADRFSSCFPRSPCGSRLLPSRYTARCPAPWQARGTWPKSQAASG
ncbi:hypothetical protein FIU85_16380 [Roseovarius sp. THAF8]|nr:hypothetical protein FIU85_16380 [Roseovarius sp. THAF8]